MSDETDWPHQDWKGMDGAIAWHLIDRHASGWQAVGEMMDAWLAANSEQPPAEAQAQGDGLPRMEQLRRFVAWEREHSPDKTHIAEWALYELRRLYVAPPPSAPVGVERLHRIVDRMAADRSYERGQAVEDLRDALAQQPTAVCHCYTTDPTNCIGTDDLAGLDCPCKCHAQQPAAVDEVMVRTALRNLPQYISKSGLVGPDMHSAMQCFEVLRDALAQQPAACPKCDGTGEADSGGIMPWGAPATIPCDCQQPAAVQKGYKNGLNAALGVIANLGVADSEAQTNGREDAYRAVEALAAQQTAATLPDEDDSDLTVAYMAGRHDGRKEAQQPAAEVYVDFPQVGTAGPLAVVDGKVTLPDTTMNDLIRHARTGYVEKPAAVDGAIPEGWRVMPFTGSWKACDERWEVYSPDGSGGVVLASEVRSHDVASLLDALAAQQGGES